MTERPVYTYASVMLNGSARLPRLPAVKEQFSDLSGLCLVRVLNGRLVDANPEAMGRFNLRNAAGERWGEALRLDRPEEAYAWETEALRGENGPALYAQAAKGARWLRLRALTSTRPSEVQEGIVLDVEDVTAERAAIERVRLEGEHFHALIERSAEGISIFDTGANILYESPSNERIHGYTRQEMEGRNLFDFCHPDDMARVMPRFTHLAEGPGVIETDIVRFRHKQGHYIYLEGIVLNATDDPRVNGLVNNFRDVTGRIEAERELRRAKDAAEQAQRLQQHWLTNLSHEFKTPLTLIRGPLADLEVGRLTTIRRKSAWQVVRRNIERLDALLTELIDLARLEAGAFAVRARQHDLVAFIRRQIGDFVPEAKAARVEIRLDAPSECRVFFDGAKLQKVVGNFLGNAAKFSPEGSTIRISIERRADEDAEGHVEVAVADEGPGMDSATSVRVFERFFQGDAGLARTHEGMGIGLAIARELVEMHGGSVGVTSELGAGSRFFFRLPLGCDHLAPDDIDTTAAPEPRPHTVGVFTRNGSPDGELQVAEEGEPLRRLLLVEDNADMRAYLRLHLDDSYLVTEATNGREAWELRAGLPPDIVLSDVMMPHVDGLELCRRIRSDARWKAVPVVLLSAKGMADHRVEGLAAGADDYLAKPFSMAELMQRLAARLPRRTMEVEARSGWWMKLVGCADENLASTGFDVATLARRLGYSPRQLRRRVAEHAGLTPARFLLERRLQRAHQAIAERRFETVAEVAHAVGLSPGYFSRCYRQQYGVGVRL